MTFVLQDIIEELERSHSLEPVKKLKKENLGKSTAHYGITQLLVQKGPIFLI